VFYHVSRPFGKLLQMEEPRDDAPCESKDAPPVPASPRPLTDDGPRNDPTTPSLGVIAPSAFQHRVQKIFVGPDGIRPIWRLALYLLIYRALRFCLHILIFYGLPEMGRLWLQTAAELGLAAVAVAPAFVMGRLEQRPLSSYGLPLRLAYGKLFGVGAVWGIISLTVLLLALHGASAFDFGTLALHGLRIVKFAVFWGVFFFIVAIYEEFLTRGYAQFTLTQMLGFWPSAVLLSLGFGVLHLENPGEDWVGILGAVLIGFFFCLTLRRTGSLWFAVGFHASWDWGESYFYSVPDSGGMAPGHLLRSTFHGPRWLTGGSVGPEASVFLFVLLAFLWVVFDRLYPEVKYPLATVKRTSDSGL